MPHLHEHRRTTILALLSPAVFDAASMASMLLVRRTAQCFRLALVLSAIGLTASACADGTLRDDVSCKQFGNCPLLPVQLSAGVSHTCALFSDGAVTCWGNNDHKQLGNSETSLGYTQTPVTVKGLSAKATAIACGGYHTCAILADQTVTCWGDNEAGQVGEDALLVSQTPTPKIVSTLTSVSAITAGYLHTCALLPGGTVKCWGQGGFGELGNGQTYDSSAPVAVSSLTGVLEISAHASNHTCALTAAHGVKCWGLAEYGQLGDSRTLTANDVAATPVDVSGLSSGVSAITVGAVHSCALLTAGSIKCWGNNDSGQLGDGTVNTANAPVTTISTAATRIIAGSFHTCAIVKEALRCWGANDSCQLGDSTKINRTQPVAVLAITTKVAELTGGNKHTCVILESGEITCWGDNSLGQLGKYQ